jgi:DNA repair protein RadC
MEKYGIDVLSNAELLAVVLNVGTKSESVMDMAKRIISDYGIGAIAEVRKSQQLRQFTGISPVKSMQVTAMLEIGRRLYLEKRGTRPLLNSPAKVYKYYKHLGHKSREELRVLYLNSRQVQIVSELVAIGSIDLLPVRKRDILAPALEHGAVGIIILHNHPSGDPSPSLADKLFTKQLESAAKILDVTILDHLIIASKDYFSFRTRGLLTNAGN